MNGSIEFLAVVRAIVIIGGLGLVIYLLMQSVNHTERRRREKRRASNDDLRNLGT